MEARIREGNGVRGGSTITGATTFNAPGFTQNSMGGSHSTQVRHKINNRTRYSSITNYQIAKREGNLRIADPVAEFGTNLGNEVRARSVHMDGLVWSFTYHDLSQFFDILSRRNNLVQ